MPILVRVDHAQGGQRLHGQATEPLIGLPSVRRGESGQSPEAGFEGLPVSGVLDDGDSPGDVIDLLLLEGFSTGRQPFARTREIDNVLVAATLLPPQARLIRDAEDNYQHSRLAVGEGWTIRVIRWKRNRRASVTVTAVTAELADEQLALSIQHAVAAAEPDQDRVPIGFWHQTQRGPRRIPRDIETAAWSQIRANYSERVAYALEPLMNLSGTAVNGRLLLLHGPPGTGKTTLLRALARQWRDWCRVDCVLDPEQLFTEPAYLLDVALGDNDDEEGDTRGWRLLLLEDCDELIRGEAKSTAGQQLSRLLNLTDGLLGQGRNVLVAITSNEDLAALHPAVVRPGRSLAHLEVGRLTQAEATAWLASGRTPVPAGIGHGGATLAELFAIRAGTSSTTITQPAPGTGLYL